MPHRARVLYRPNHRDVKVQQVITPGAGALQLLKKVQSLCRLRRDGVDMLSPLQVPSDMHTQQLKRGDAFHRCAVQTDGRRRVKQRKPNAAVNPTKNAITLLHTKRVLHAQQRTDKHKSCWPCSALIWNGFRICSKVLMP